MGLLTRLRQGLIKTQNELGKKLQVLTAGKSIIDEQLWEDFTDLLISSDIGINTTTKIIETLKIKAKEKRETSPQHLRELLRDEIINIFSENETSLNLNPEGKTVFLIVGVNGGGKTTSIAKLAYRYKKEGKKVLLIAADTFRAAAIDQLEIWAKRVEVDIMKAQVGADPAAVVYDGLQSAKSRNIDLILVDTAGRLHTKVNLMEELKKINRVIIREKKTPPEEVLLVLDATIGQNGLNQARLFKEAVEVSGIILTKLDGTAKGGIVLAIWEELKIPIKLVGIGETLLDLEPFDKEIFATALTHNGT